MVSLQISMYKHWRGYSRSSTKRYKFSTPFPTTMGRLRGRTHQSEGLSGRSLSVGKFDGVATLHNADCVVPGDFIVNGFALGPDDEFVEVESWRVVLEDLGVGG